VRSRFTAVLRGRALREGHPIAHGPGPPHRPHIPGADEALLLLAPSTDDTANTLSARAVCFEPHDGQGTVSGELIDRTSFSNLVSHDLHAYS